MFKIDAFEVMNSVNGVTTLTTAEKRYLQEIYSKFVG
jgi:hypothetical protein